MKFKRVYDFYEQQNFLGVLEALDEIENVDQKSESMLNLIEIDCLLQTKNTEKGKKKFFKLRQTKGNFFEQSEEKIKNFYLDLESRIMNADEDPEFLTLKNEYLNNSDNIESCFALAKKSKEIEKYEISVELFLKILENDKKNKGKEAIEHLKEIFIILGSGNDIVKNGRREMSMLLY